MRMLPVSEPNMPIFGNSIHVIRYTTETKKLFSKQQYMNCINVIIEYIYDINNIIGLLIRRTVVLAGVVRSPPHTLIEMSRGIVLRRG